VPFPLGGGHQERASCAFDDLPQRLEEFAFERLAATDVHAWTVRGLAPIHNDPFDRLLVAQAICECATVVSADPVFGSYAVARIS
jgi:PIN domain nuclease of toxin-antitoxin system